MPNKVTMFSLFIALGVAWSSDFDPSMGCPADTAQAAAEEYVVLLQRSLGMQEMLQQVTDTSIEDAGASGASTDTSQELQQEERDTLASSATEDTSQNHKQQEEQQRQQQQQQHSSRGGDAGALAMTAKSELAAANSGVQREKEEVFPSLPPPEVQDRDYVRDDDHEEVARRRREALQRAAEEAVAKKQAEQAAQEAAKQAALKDTQAREEAERKAKEEAERKAKEDAEERVEERVAEERNKAQLPEPRLSPEDEDFVEHKDNVKVVPVGMVLNFNDELQEKQEELRQAAQKEGSSLVERMRLEVKLERARQEAEAAHTATAGQKGVVEAAAAQEVAFTGTVEKAAALHKHAEEAYLLTLNYNSTSKEDDKEPKDAKDIEKLSAEEKGVKARTKVIHKVAKAAKWMIGSNETGEPRNRTNDPEVLELHSIVLEAEALEERMKLLEKGLKNSKSAAEAKLADLTSDEEVKRHNESEARSKLLEAAAEADSTVSSANEIASGALEKAESFLLRLVADPAGELRGAASPGSKLAVVPLLIVTWAAAVAL